MQCGPAVNTYMEDELLQEQQDKRREKIYRRLRVVAKPLMSALLGYRWEPIPETEGPVLIVCNHNTDLDCVMVGIAANRACSYVATENILRMGFFSRLVTDWIDIIVHYKGIQGTATVRTILKKVRDGSSVILFPEGNRSFNGLTCPIPPATGKMARSLGATLVTYRLRGGYLSWPRWGKSFRRGRIRGELAGVYSPEQLKGMSAKEVQQLIEKDLFVDAYEDQKKDPVRYKSSKPAESVESALFLCPSCGGIGKLRSRKKRVYCECGWEAFMDEYGLIEAELPGRDEGAAEDAAGAAPGASPDTSSGTALRKTTMTELDAMQQKKLALLLESSAPGELLFSDRVRARFIDEGHGEAESEETELRAYGDRFEAGSAVMRFSDISGVAINQRNLLLIHETGSAGHREFTADISFSALKYLYLFRAAGGSGNGSL